MSPEFAKAADNVFLYVLGLLDRIERNEAPIASEERAHIRNRIDQADAMLGGRDDWNLAKYALVAWIDDMLIEAPWDGRSWWEENALEVDLFERRDAFTLFYEKAQEAATLTKKDALEVFYVCVVLGFRGLYRDASGQHLAEEMGIEPDVESWARKVGMAVQLGSGRPPINDTGSPGAGAPPLEGKFQLVGASLVFVVLAGISLMLLAWQMLR